MLGIEKITGGRFGNRVLHYNNLMQLSLAYNVPAYCGTWEGHQWFEDIVSPTCNDFRPPTRITWREVLDGKYSALIEQGLHCTIGGELIHNFYYELTRVHPRVFLKIKTEFLPSLNSSVNVGVHIRGGDILGADGNAGREIHSYEYYREAMSLVNSSSQIGSVYVCTDDITYSLFQRVLDYATQVFGKERVLLGPSTASSQLPHIHDFATLSQCDYLISSSSTYAVCAGFLGKEKKIIHSKEWIQKNLQGETYVRWGRHTHDHPQPYWDQYDKFWRMAYTLENEFYKPWSFV